MSPIVQNIVMSSTNILSKKRPDPNWQNHGQHDSSYYQPQTAVQNHFQQYRHDRRIQHSSLKNNCDRDKGVAITWHDL